MSKLAEQLRCDIPVVKNAFVNDGDVPFIDNKF